jgi:hypothetical protein
MNTVTMRRARAEAQRFLATVAEMELRLSKDAGCNPASEWFGCPESSALRRASMDLTRALAALRRSG